MQMDEKYELKQELEQELQWVKYRQKMLDIVGKKSTVNGANSRAG